MKIEQPLQPRFRPMIGFGTTLSTMSSVGAAFVSAAVSPGAQPGKPPVGDHTPAVLVQFPSGGGALEVTLYAVGTQTSYTVAAPSAASRTNVTAVDTKSV